jgi:hypothetical protein
MRTKATSILALTILIVLVAACDRSPYDLALRVTDQEDNPIPRATAILEELEDLRMTDSLGTVTWTDLEEGTVTLIVGAQGYVPRSLKVTMERGHNDLVVALEQAIPVYDPTNP